MTLIRSFVFDVDAVLRHLITTRSSDLHFKVPEKPLVRTNGGLTGLERFEVLTAQDTEGAVRHLLRDERKLAKWAADGEVDFSYAIEGLARFRVNAFRQRGWASLVICAIPVSIRTIDRLLLTGDVLADLSRCADPAARRRRRDDDGDRRS